MLNHPKNGSIQIYVKDVEGEGEIVFLVFLAGISVVGKLIEP